MRGMISVGDAQAPILAQVIRVAPPEVVALGACLGRVLAEDVRAAFDVPPTANSAVDGYAVRSEDIPSDGRRELTVVADLAAGAVFDGVLGPGEALRIMTGAPMPAGGGTAYPQEIVERSGRSVRIRPGPAGVNVRHRGEDGQTTDHGIVPDLYDVLHARLRTAAATADVVLTSGGVSVGDHDLVKAVLQDAGGIDFWQVAMQPGRPLAVGRIGSAHFFGLPGNPVASMLTFHLFVRPALWKLAGRRELFPPRFHAVAMEPMSKKPGRREFKRGILSYGGERWEVRITGPQGSGILTSMTLANCFVVIEEERGDVAAGQTVSVEPFALA